MISNNNIPQGYKQTEFGYIPLDWNICTFKDVLSTFSSGATPYRGIPEYYKGEVRWISSGELNYNHIYDTLEHISKQAVKNTNLRVHQPDTFLIAITGLEAEGTRGRCAIVAAPSTTNQSCLAINGTDKMCVEYLFWFYSMWGEYLAFKYSQGTKQQSFTAEIVKKLPIYCPSNIAEQKAIATALSDVDALITALDKKIAKKKLIKQGAMQQLLTGKKRLPGFTEEWVEIKLGDIGNLLNGYSFKSEKYNVSGKFKVVTIANVKNGKLDTNDCNRVLDIPSDLQEHQRLKVGDILISMTGNVGRVCMVNTNGCLQNQRVGLFSLLDNFHFDKNFIYTIINSKDFETEMIDSGQGAAQSNINKKDIEGYTFYSPINFKEQQSIATILSDMDKEISDLESKCDKYRLIKQGMMQKLLTGQIRLKTT